MGSQAVQSSCEAGPGACRLVASSGGPLPSAGPVLPAASRSGAPAWAHQEPARPSRPWGCSEAAVLVPKSPPRLSPPPQKFRMRWTAGDVPLVHVDPAWGPPRGLRARPVGAKGTGPGTKVIGGQRTPRRGPPQAPCCSLCGTGCCTPWEQRKTSPQSYGGGHGWPPACPHVHLHTNMPTTDTHTLATCMHTHHTHAQSTHPRAHTPVLCKGSEMAPLRQQHESTNLWTGRKLRQPRSPSRRRSGASVSQEQGRQGRAWGGGSVAPRLRVPGCGCWCAGAAGAEPRLQECVRVERESRTSCRVWTREGSRDLRRHG